MDFSIVVSIEMATNMKAEVSRFLFNLAGYQRRHRASFYLPGDLRAQTIDDVEPTIPTTETPTHASLCPVAVPVTEYVGVTLAKKVVKFLSHGSLNQNFGTGGQCASAKLHWLLPKPEKRTNLLLARGTRLRQEGSSVPLSKV
jgi:hypothetical protein